jgi:hypothetical protein
MSVFTFPGFGVETFRWRKVMQAITFRGPFGGSQSLEGGVPLWEVEMMGPVEFRIDAHAVESYIESLDGYRHQVELWNVQHPTPAGTMRGTMALNASAAQGATTLSITAGVGQAAKTLLEGDLIGIGSGTTQQVARIKANATANGAGVIAVTIGTPLRNAFAAGAAVTWDKPKALFRQKALSDGLEYSGAFGRGWSLSLIEDWRA